MTGIESILHMSWGHGQVTLPLNKKNLQKQPWERNNACHYLVRQLRIRHSGTCQSLLWSSEEGFFLFRVFVPLQNPALNPFNSESDHATPFWLGDGPPYAPLLPRMVMWVVVTCTCNEGFPTNFLAVFFLPFLPPQRVSFFVSMSKLYVNHYIWIANRHLLVQWFPFIHISSSYFIWRLMFEPSLQAW